MLLVSLMTLEVRGLLTSLIEVLIKFTSGNVNSHLSCPDYFMLVLLMRREEVEV